MSSILSIQRIYQRFWFLLTKEIQINFALSNCHACDKRPLKSLVIENEGSDYCTPKLNMACVWGMRVGLNAIHGQAFITFRRQPGRLLNFLFTFDLGPASKGGFI